MKNIFVCLTYCLLTFSTLAQVTSNLNNGESVLDGVYIETHSSFKKVLNNHLSSLYYHNYMFCVPYRKLENSKTIITSSYDPKKITSISKKLALDNCIYFDASKNYKNGNGFSLAGEDIVSGSDITLPFSLRYYITADNITLFPDQALMQLDSNFTLNKEKYLKPFYFLKHEVSNIEYRGFVTWVKDSIARRLLANEFPEDFSIPIYDNNGKMLPKEKWPLNWEKEFNYNAEVDSQDYSPILGQLYLSKNERFYNRKEIDTKKLIYEYCIQVDDAILTRNIPIYPDTLCWVNDFDQSDIVHMTNMYFWHPAYDQYPVVGVNYHQVTAFLHWKTNRHQKMLNESEIPYEMTYSLPTVAEWDMVSTATKENNQIDIYNENYYHLGDDSWITDLSLNNANNIRKTDSTDTIINITIRTDQLTHFINNNSSYKGAFSIDGGFFTQKVMPEKKDKNSNFSAINIDQNGIYYMGGNVSEWLQESYSNNWESIFTKRHAFFNNIKDEDVQLLLQIEKYYNKKNATNGRLVMGANWYDERFSSKLGINSAGINAKTFVDPSSSYSTLGFRYVVRVKEK